MPVKISVESLTPNYEQRINFIRFYIILRQYMYGKDNSEALFTAVHK